MHPIWKSKLGKLVIGNCGTQFGMISALSGLVVIFLLGLVCASVNMLSFGLTQRVAKLAGILAQELAPGSKEHVERAAFLAKADLLTAMVNEFPSLQGVMGRDYALLDNEPPEVATAILEHYLPVRAGGNVPAQIPGALVGMADRLDTIAGCFGIGQVPTGTTDPFGSTATRRTRTPWKTTATLPQLPRLSRV